MLPKKSFYSVNDNREINKDVEAYASDLKIDLDIAAHQLALQELAGNLDAELSTKEADTYAGLWIQHSPQFRIIVQFTQEGENTIRQYIENGPLTEVVDVREVGYTLEELKAAQVATQSEIRNLDIPTNSGINILENKVELYVIERSRLEATILDTKMQLPPQVNVITVSELSAEQTDIYAGLRINASNQADCTSGFSVTNSSGLKGILTAAHCDNTMSYNGVNLTFQSSAYGGPFDFQWHAAPGFNVRNLAYDGTNNRYIFSTKHRDNQSVGEWVCKNGWASGYTCGYISDKNFYPGGPMSDTLIRVHRDGVNLSSGGDSGGPWFVANTAYGLHIGEIGDDAYYMAINYIDFLDLSVLTTTPGTPSTICLPIIMNDLIQPENIIDPENNYAYPSPNDEEASFSSPSGLEPNPYP